MKINNKTDFTKTLNLQKETILMDGNLVKREGYFLDKMHDTKKYKEIVENNLKRGAKKYKMAELPTYIEDRVNPTMVINKVLKDIVIRHKFLNNAIVEHSLLFTNMGDITINSENKDNAKDIAKSKVAARKRIADIIRGQVLEVNNLGTLFNYEKHTKSSILPEFEDRMLDKFYELYTKDKLKREVRPVNWCTKCNSSFQRDKVNIRKAKVNNLYVKFKVKDDKGILSKYHNLENTYFIASTIRPWTLLSCQYLALAQNAKYDIVEIEDQNKTYHYIIAEDCTDDVMQLGFYIKYDVKETINASQLEECICEDPLEKTKSIPILLTKNEYVFYDQKNNTGIHMVSSGHTYFDYLILKEHNIDNIYTILDGQGKVNNRALMLQGLDYVEASHKIVEQLKAVNLFYASHGIDTYISKCQICNHEILYRPIIEWYLQKSADDLLTLENLQDLKEKLIAYPNYFETDLKKQWKEINKIKETIISDEKILGTPIPVFYCADCGKIVITQKSIEILKSVFKNKGVDAWYRLSPDEMLKGQVSCSCGCGFFFKEDGTLNDFFKLLCSPISDNEKVPTICIENDDIFYHKLKAYSFENRLEQELHDIEQIVIHARVDENTQDIAKPLFYIKENKQEEKEIMKKNIGVRDIVKKYGTDVLRLWAFSEANQTIIKLTEQKIIETNRIYNKLRQTLKFLLSNVYDFNPFKDRISVEERTDLDKYIYVRLKNFYIKANDLLDQMQFDQVYELLKKFCIEDLNALYFDMIKYDLYVLNANDPIRRSIQSTMYDIIFSFIKVCEPILPFTIEEIWSFIWHPTPEEEKNTLLFKFDLEDVQNDFITEQKRINSIVFIRNNLNQYIRRAIEEKVIKNSLEAKVKITTNESTAEFINRHYEELVKYLNISSIEVKVSDVHKIKILKEPGTKCARCGHYSINIGINLKYRYLCEKCARILEQKEGK